MNINTTNLETVAAGFRALIAARLPKVASIWRDLAMEVPSTGASETYNWMDAVAQVVEWLDEITLGNLKSYSFTIINRLWNINVPVDGTIIEDDKLGIVNPAIQQIADSFEGHIDKLVTELFTGGFAATGYDGKNFFATNHASGSNKSTAKLGPTPFVAAMTAMMSQKDVNDQPIDIRGTHLLVGPQSWAQGRAIVEVPTLTGGAANPNYGAAKLVVNPRITGYEWGLFDLSKPMKPFIVQTRSRSAFQWIAEPFKNGKAKGIFGGWARYNGGYGLHQLGHGSDGSTGSLGA